MSRIHGILDGLVAIDVFSPNAVHGRLVDKQPPGCPPLRDAAEATPPSRRIRTRVVVCEGSVSESILDGPYNNLRIFEPAALFKGLAIIVGREPSLLINNVERVAREVCLIVLRMQSLVAFRDLIGEMQRRGRRRTLDEWFARNMSLRRSNVPQDPRRDWTGSFYSPGSFWNSGKCILERRPTASPSQGRSTLAEERSFRFTA